MTSPSYPSDYFSHLTAEGSAYPDTGPPDTTQEGGGPPLPDKDTLKKLTDALNCEYRASSTDRQDHMRTVVQAWDSYNQTPYLPDEMLMSEQQSVRVPIIRSRVDQAHNSLYAALALSPFFEADVGEGQSGTVALHAEAAIGQELDRAEFENALDIALRGSLVGSLGVFKTLVVPGEDGQAQLSVEAVDITELYFSPHEVRDLSECTLVGHRYAQTMRHIQDQAIDGTYDPEAVKKLGIRWAEDQYTTAAAERRVHDLQPFEGAGGRSDESRKINILEAYIRIRPGEGQASEWWRVYAEVDSWIILRAEPWEDGLPFTVLRHQRGQTTMYAPSFAAVLRDLQWASDQLFSASIEADRMGVMPTWEVDVLSPAMEWLRNKQDKAGGAAVRPLPGEVVPKKGIASGITAIYHQPTPPQIEQRLNRIESLANVATIPVTPMQTYRSATEHRYAQAGVSAKEQQMLKVLRADLTRFGEYVKRLYWKYLAAPDAPDGSTKWVVHGSQRYNTQKPSWDMIRLTPRGMTTAADKMLAMQTSEEMRQILLQILPQKAMMMQAGVWPAMWAALRAWMVDRSIDEYAQYIGPDPINDPSLQEMDPVEQQRQAQASMLLMQAQQGQVQQQGPPQPVQGMAPGEGVPGDNGQFIHPNGAPTVMPGGNPTGRGAN